ncbi:MAG: polymerase, sigma-24 subunit, subfamily [Herbinix sp.]|nr:polymerase, sigma-24 subunit, subfamily [Herbinix sp.]
MDSDKILYQDFLDGDTSAFEELVLRYRHNLVYFMMQFLKDYQNSEDIAQEVFAYIYLNPQNYSSNYQFKTYLFMLGKRRAIDFLRKNSRKKLIPLEDIEAEDIQSLEEIIYKKEDAGRLKQAMNGLKPEYRQVLVLIYLNEFSMAETAEVMKRSVAATKVLSHRAKKSLKMILEKGGIGYEI